MFHFDWTINVSALVTGTAATVAVIGTMIKLGRQFVRFMCVDHFRVTTMWGTYIREYPADHEEAVRRDPLAGRTL
jgi:hypothetical protein